LARSRVYTCSRTEGARTSFLRTFMALSARYMRMPSNPFACVGRRSSCFGSTRTAVRRTMVEGLARIWIMRRGAVAIAPLLTPGIGKVKTTEPSLCPTFHLTRRIGNFRRHWRHLESTSDWRCVRSLPSSLVGVF
jgi:hypothetical protein